MTILIIYHKPGRPEQAASLIQELQSLVKELSGYDTDTRTIGSVTPSDCQRASAVFLLLPTRGGHWLEIREKGCKAQTPPKYLLASIIAREIRRHGNKQNPLLVFLESRRAKNIQRQDVDLLTRFIKLHGYNPIPVFIEKTTDPIEAMSGDIIVPFAMLPGRLVENARETAHRHGIPSLGPILAYAIRDVATWITEAIENEPKP